MARNKYPEITVEKILDAAQRLFLEKGYDNTTIQDIVDELAPPLPPRSGPPLPPGGESYPTVSP